MHELPFTPEEMISARAALAGADARRDAIALMIRMGTAGLADDCYTYKSRTKDLDSLINKVRARRVGDGGRTPDPEYSADRVRDIIGIRLLALHPGKITNITRRLVRFIQAGMSNDIGLFAGPTLDDCIEEIIVYKSVGHPKAYDETLRFCSSLGLERPAPKGGAKVRSESSTRDRPYSSVHIVCMCVDKDGRRGSPIPVEFQIRTPLEDVWAELDHPRNYKPNRSSSRFEQLREDAREYMSLLKSDIDSSLGHIELIVRMYDQLETSGSEFISVTPASGQIRLSVRHKILDRAPISVKKAVIKLEEQLDAIQDKVDKRDTSATDIASEVVKTLANIRRVRTRYGDNEGTDDANFHYWVKCSLGDLYLWRAGALRALGLTAEAAEALTEAGANYESLVKAEPTDAYARYQYGYCLVVSGAPIDLALVEMRAAINLLDDDKRDGLRGVTAGDIYHYVAYLLWTRRLDLVAAEKSALAAKPRLRREQTALIDEAYLCARREWAELSHTRPTDPRYAEQRDRAANHVVCFAWELAHVFDLALPTIPPDSLEAGRLLAQNICVAWDTVSDNRLDSALRMGILDGDHPMVKRIVDRFTEHSANWPLDRKSDALRECLGIAQRWLKQNRNSRSAT